MLPIVMPKWESLGGAGGVRVVEYAGGSRSSSAAAANSSTATIKKVRCMRLLPIASILFYLSIHSTWHSSLSIVYLIMSDYFLHMVASFKSRVACYNNTRVRANVHRAQCD